MFTARTTSSHVAVLLPLSFALSGCASMSPANVQAPQQIFDSLQESYPQGIPVDVATATMQAAGFECELVGNGQFKHQLHNPESAEGKYKTYDNIDFLECHRKRQVGLVTYFDEVALVVEDEAVVQILINWSAVGP